MAKASPIVRSFNAGLFSPLMEGRVDIDKYPASLRQCKNFISAPQGPLVRRSGTQFFGPVKNEGNLTVLRSFVFSESQVYNLEFGNFSLRFVNDNGLLVRPAIAVTASTGTTLSIAAHGAGTGDELVLNGFPSSVGINGSTVKVTGVPDANHVTIDTNVGTSVLGGSTASLVYTIGTPYSSSVVNNIYVEQSVDVVYVFCDGYRPKKLSRSSAYSWAFSDLAESDGPYLPINTEATRITPQSTGNPIPFMTSNTTPSGVAGVFNLDGSAVVGGQAWPVFAEPNSLALPALSSSTAVTQLMIQYTFVSPTIPTGFTLYASRDNTDTTHSALDFAPMNFDFQGLSGGTWVTLDSEVNYVLYDNYKSAYFKLKNTTAFDAIRLRILGLKGTGALVPKLRRMTITSAATASIGFLASNTLGINGGQGFLTSDVGRYFRFQGSDGLWRSFTITEVDSPTAMIAKLQGEALPDLASSTNWRLGYWSDTTGWPDVGLFYNDRLFMGGTTGYPDLLVGSKVSDYENFQQTDNVGIVQDDSAIVVRLNARKLSRIRWIQSDQHGLLLGTGSQEWSVQPADAQSGLSAKNIKAIPTTGRGSADILPVTIDQSFMYVQRSKRTIRKLNYEYQSDGYKSPSMSIYASNMGSGASQFEQLEYAQEPYSIVWVRRADGTLAGLTFNEEENVVGWHEHDVGGFIESINVMPTTDGLQDALWMIVRRTINGQTRRYIERLREFWDFNSTIPIAHFIDCGLRYQGTPITTVTGLRHLEGEVLCGLADGSPIEPRPVVGGSITLLVPASNIILGKGYRSVAETARLDAGAADGTAQGKTKRINNIVARLWATGSHWLGRRAAAGEISDKLDPIDLRKPDDLTTNALPLFTGDFGPIVFPEGYDQEGSVLMVAEAATPLPYNVIALMPQMNTQDR